METAETVRIVSKIMQFVCDKMRIVMIDIWLGFSSGKPPERYSAQHNTIKMMTSDRNNAVSVNVRDNEIDPKIVIQSTGHQTILPLSTFASPVAGLL